MKRRKASGRLRVVVSIVAVVATGVAVARRAEADGIEQRTDVREELTAATTADTLFNPGGQVFVAKPATNRLRARSEVTVQLPAAIAFKAIGTLEALHAPGDRAALEWALPEAYLRRSFGRAQLSVGRKILRWSNGYAFAPAGLLDPPRDPSDPQDRLGRFEGRDLVELDLYAGSHTISSVYAPGKILPGSNVKQEGLLALRYQVLVHGADLSLMAAHRLGSLDTAAASANYVLGSALEVHAEAAFSRGSEILLPRSSLPGGEQTLYGPIFYAPLRLGDGRLYVRWLLGLNYTLPGGLNFIAEYSHASDALASGEWQRYLDQVRFSGAAFESGAYPPLSNGRSLPELNLLLAMQGLGSGSLGRDYGFIRVARTYRVPAVESSVLAFANLRDGSLALVPEFSVRVQRRMTVYGRATFPIGSKESEFGNIPIARSANLGLRVAF